MSWEFTDVFTHTKEVDEKVIVDEASASVTYIGYAKPGTALSAPEWKIKRLTETGNIKPVTEYANGNCMYNNVWDDRASLDYL